MDWKYLFTSFEGRIGRLRWWAGTIAFLFAFVILLTVPRVLYAIPALDSLMSIPSIQILVQITWSAVFFYVTAALMKKRLNDRDRPIWYLYVFLSPGMFSTVLSLTGLGYNMTDMGGAQVPTPNTLLSIIEVASFVTCIWSTVELGILKGTAGQNQYGPDPLANDVMRENMIQARLGGLALPVQWEKKRRFVISNDAIWVSVGLVICIGLPVITILPFLFR